MAAISFKAKIEDVYKLSDGAVLAYRQIKVPRLDRKHCDMNAFRTHPGYRDCANSTLFPTMLARIRKERLGDIIRLDRIPDGVSVDTSSFLARVTLDIQ